MRYWSHGLSHRGESMGFPWECELVFKFHGNGNGNDVMGIKRNENTAFSQ